jgi:tetrahydromethanopterin S-methyltransferase subunit G
MPSAPLTPRELVDRLDARHEELIARLDELNAQIEATLAEFGRTREKKTDSDAEMRNAA